MVKNQQLRISRSEIDDTRPLFETMERFVGDGALRWYISQTTDTEVVVEATLLDEPMPGPSSGEGRQCHPGKSVVLNIVPTGIGCSIGGYAGDAAPAANLLASVTDYLITNPNALNASDFIGLGSNNIVYTEGCSIDLFCRGLVDLYLPRSNKVGLIVEKSEGWKLDVVFNILNTVRAVHGVDITDYVITERPLGGRCVENQSGAFVGTLDDPQTLFEACEKLIKNGVDAIAITSSIQDLPYENYVKHFEGEYPNPVGGVEAIISYLVTREFQVPAAHAPLLNLTQLDLKNKIVDARGAGEISSASGLACILIGLRTAPQIKPEPRCRVADIININNLMAVVSPASCLGGIPALYSQKYGIPLVAVKDNRTILNVTQSDVGLGNVIEVGNYAEAAGVILALKKGISLQSIVRPLTTYRY